ncbi:hypothetical protein UFOVP1465_44 [uncultured Caudovirales phage]|uniref:Uncharacterized protein n=3 Tax=uncultured Caudovirales phage TaxID=2100421 RepID=A0A6J5SJJ7_9CAUD|nr:hypothetical protein UFOVP1465_44 [uncultured Caudovirales phage]
MAETETQQPDVAGDAIRSALGTEMGGPLADIYKKEREASRKVAESQLSQKEGEARGIQKAQESFAGGERQRYEAARPQINAPPPKFNVTQDTQEGLMGLATLLPIAGILIGSKGMMSGTNAMNAMTGVMKGYQEGNKERMTFEKQKYDVAMKEWDTHIKQVKDSLDKYTELARYDLSSATSKAKADAIAKGHGVIGDLIDQQGLVKAREIVEKMALEKQKAHTALSRTMSEVGGLGSTAKLASIFGPELAARTPPKEAEKLIGGLNSIKSTMDLIKKAQDPEIKFGELGRIGVNISAAFGRNLGSDNSELSPQAVSNSIDQAADEAGLSPTDKNVVFYKEAIFTALDLERAARGGSILPVAIMKTLTPLLDPRTTTREAYTEILRRRAVDVARSTGLSQEQLNLALTKMPSVNIGMPGAAAPRPASDVVNVSSEAEAEALPRGTKFNLNGRTGTVE